MSLPANYAEIICDGSVASGGMVAMYRRRYCKVFFLSFPKCSSRFSNVLLIAVNPVTSIPLLHYMGSLFFGDKGYILHCSVAFEVCVEAILNHIYL